MSVQGGGSGGSGGATGERGTRIPISLACTECTARNYKTTKSPGDYVELKKFCKQCKKHTLHRETK
ncbi:MULTISPECIES: 50S ribosomal protein L33 [Polyangium]|uniref:Large ribosomal subunit protein bL33 n=1 Tax=Polyangium fumosum TaxID=889272 RepID=A0A4U1J8F8_9BACT|nr:50S ribosomal protein L33 [Polyangium fumosum]